MTFDKNEIKYEVKDDHLNALDTWPGGFMKQYDFKDINLKREHSSDNVTTKLVITNASGEEILVCDPKDKGFHEFDKKIKESYSAWSKTFMQ